MDKPKTQRNDGDVAAYLASVPDPRRRADAETACTRMQEVTGEPAQMWGTSIVGFGTLRMRYADGHIAECRRSGWPPASG